MQTQLASCILKSDIGTIESKHSGKYIAHFFYDVAQVSQLVGSGILNLMKDSLTLIVLVSLSSPFLLQQLRKPPQRQREPAQQFPYLA